jgi:hypothetical protein
MSTYRPNSPAVRCAAKDLERNLDQMHASQEEREAGRKIFVSLMSGGLTRPQAARRVAVREVRRARERADDTPGDASKKSA